MTSSKRRKCLAFFFYFQPKLKVYSPFHDSASARRNEEKKIQHDINRTLVTKEERMKKKVKCFQDINITDFISGTR